MDVAGLVAVFTAAIIWALLIFLYKGHRESLDAAVVNFSRLFMSPSLCGLP